MAKYIIPEQFIPGFKLLSTLSMDQVQIIKDAFVESPIGSGPEEIVKNIEIKKELKGNKLEMIVNTIFSFLSISSRQEVKKNKFVNDIINSFENISDESENKDKLSTKN